MAVSTTYGIPQIISLNGIIIMHTCVVLESIVIVLQNMWLSRWSRGCVKQSKSNKVLLTKLKKVSCK